MAWNLRGHYYAPCSCKVGCPCVFGELEGDHGWCSATLVFDIDSGNVDGVDVSGTKGALSGEWPSGFLSGNGKGQMYIDPRDTPEQREALASVFEGKKGGVFEILASLLTEVLPNKEAPIDIKIDGDHRTITVGDYGTLEIEDMKGPSGELTRVLHGAAAFRDNIILARGHGSNWRDPDLRQWESSGHAEREDFEFSA
jgi:hypothetical protein